MHSSDEARWQNRTGLVFAIDNHIVDGETPAELEIKQLHTDGWIQLVLTDVTRTEWKAAEPTPGNSSKNSPLAILSIGDR